MNIWTLYNTQTLDFPGLYVARRFNLNNPTADHFAHESKNTVEVWVRKNAAKFGNFAPHRVQRDPRDDQNIIESYL